jgi:hypothetical protein
MSIKTFWEASSPVESFTTRFLLAFGIGYFWVSLNLCERLFGLIALKCLTDPILYASGERFAWRLPCFGLEEFFTLCCPNGEHHSEELYICP